MPPVFYAHDPFLAIQHALQRPWLDLPAAVLSTACEGWALSVIALVLLAILERTPRKLLAAYLPLLAALLASAAVVEHLKDWFATPRPLTVYGPERVHVELEPLYTLGFPSGHSSAVATFASFVVLAYGRRLRGVMLFALLGGVSRVYVGAHWVTDVVGGWGLGVLLGSSTYAAIIFVDPRGHLASRRRARRRGGARLDPPSGAPSAASSP